MYATCPLLRSDDYDDTSERIMDAGYDPLTGAVHFTTLPFGKPLGFMEGLLECTLSVSFNGLNFVDGPDFIFIVEPPKKIGYIFFGSINDFGWTYAQNIGRLETDTKFTGLVRSTYVVDVPEGGECMDAHGKSAWDWDTLSCTTTDGSPHWSEGYELMQKYCEEGYDLIFACSFGYLWQMADLSMRPVCENSKLIHVSGFFRTPKLNTAFARIFESRYLAGMIAGRALKAGTVRHNKAVGYLAAFPLPEVKQGINAFTVGCREVFPACDVRVMYIATWGDEFTETKAAEWFWEQEDCDIITQHSDTESPQIVFAKEGGYGIGYHVDQRLVVGDSVLTSAVIRWGPIFSHFVNHLLNDDYRNGQDYWPGYEAGACDITNLSPETDQETANIVTMRKQQLIDGEWQVFCKEPVNNPATTQKSFSGATAGSEEMWLHDGSFLDAVQPNIPGVTFGSGIPNFAEYTFGGRQRTCLSNFPGILDMWWDVQGVSYPTKSNGKPFAPNDAPEQLPGGTLAFKGGMVWYTPPPKDPPNPPDVRMGSLDYHQIELEFASEASEDGDEIVAYMIQADVDQEFSHVKDVAVANAVAEGEAAAGKVLLKCGYATDTAMCHIFSIMPDGGLFVSNGDGGNETDRFAPAFTPLQASTDQFPRFLSSVQLQYATLPNDADKIDLYYLRVAAFDGTSFSKWSQIKTVVTQTIPSQPAVKIIEVLQGSDAAQDGFFVEVQGMASPNGEGVLGLEVQINTQPNFKGDGIRMIVDTSGHFQSTYHAEEDTTMWCNTLAISNPNDASAGCDTNKQPALFFPSTSLAIEKCVLVESLNGCYNFVLRNGIGRNVKGVNLYARARSLDTQYHSEWSAVDGAHYIRVLDPILGAAEDAVYAFAAITIIVAVVFCGGILAHKSHRVIKRASPTFCVMMCVGVVVVAASCFVGDPDPSTANCQTHFTLLLVGYSLVIGPQFAKTWRIMKIMTDKSFRKQVTKVQPSTLQT